MPTNHGRRATARNAIQPTWACELQRVGFAYLGSTKSAIQDLVKETQKIGKIEPEPAIETSCVEASIDERIVPLDHHEAFAFHAMHNSRYDVRS